MPATLGLAIASFALSLVSVVLIVLVIPALVAFVLGLVALHKIKKAVPARKGRGLALAGVIIGLVVALGGIALDVALVYAASRTTSYRSLEPGDCIKNPGTGQVFLLRRQSCSGRHERQVFAVIDDPAPSSTKFPGATPLRTLAASACNARFAGGTASVPNRSELGVFFLVPSQSSWEDDDNRRIICMVGNRDGSPMTGPLPGLES